MGKAVTVLEVKAKLRSLLKGQKVRVRKNRWGDTVIVAGEGEKELPKGLAKSLRPYYELEQVNVVGPPRIVIWGRKGRR